MKIALFCEALSNSAGIERMTIDLANILCEQHSIIIISISHINKLPYPLNDKVKLISLNSQFKNYVKNIKLLRKTVKQLKFDIMITVAVPLTRISIPALVGLPTKNIAWEHFNLYAGSKLGCYWKLLSTKLVNHTVVLTDADKKNMEKYVNAPITCIPNFTTIDSNQNINLDSNLVLAIGRLEHQKGFDLLLKTWAQVTKKCPKWTLRIVGSGSLEHKLKEEANILGIKKTIEFKQSTQDILSIYKNASCYIMSSRYEGLPMVLIEAKTLGLPCISFDCPYGPAEIIQNGKDGFIVPMGDIDELANKLIIMLNNKNLLKQMSIKAKEDGLNRYSPMAVIKKWNNLLANV